MFLRMVVLLFFQKICHIVLSFQTSNIFNRQSNGFRIGILTYQKSYRDTWTCRHSSNHIVDEAEQANEDDPAKILTKRNSIPSSKKERAVAELRDLKNSISKLGTKISSQSEVENTLQTSEKNNSKTNLHYGSVIQSRASKVKESSSLSSSISTLGSRLDSLTSKVSSKQLDKLSLTNTSHHGSGTSQNSMERNSNRASSLPSLRSSSATPISTPNSSSISRRKESVEEIEPPTNPSQRASSTASYLENLSSKSTYTSPDGGIFWENNAEDTKQVSSTVRNSYLNSLPSQAFAPYSKNINSVENQTARPGANLSGAVDMRESNFPGDSASAMGDILSSELNDITTTKPFSASFAQSIKRIKKDVSSNSTANPVRPTLISTVDETVPSSTRIVTETLDSKKSSDGREADDKFQLAEQDLSEVESIGAEKKDTNITADTSTNQLRLIHARYATSISSTSSYLDSLSTRPMQKKTNISIQSVPDSVVGCMVLAIGFWIIMQFLAFVWDHLF